MRTHLDPFLKELTSKTFKVQMFDKHNQERLSASVSTCFRDFEEGGPLSIEPLPPSRGTIEGLAD